MTRIKLKIMEAGPKTTGHQNTCNVTKTSNEKETGPVAHGVKIFPHHIEVVKITMVIAT